MAQWHTQAVSGGSAPIASSNSVCDFSRISCEIFRSGWFPRMQQIFRADGLKFAGV